MRFCYALLTCTIRVYILIEMFVLFVVEVRLGLRASFILYILICVCSFGKVNSRGGREEAACVEFTGLTQREQQQQERIKYNSNNSSVNNKINNSNYISSKNSNNKRRKNSSKNYSSSGSSNSNSNSNKISSNKSSGI